MNITPSMEYNAEVKKAQQYLNRLLLLGAFRSKWQRLNEDGFFGYNTTQAVKSFQLMALIPQTGNIDDRTMAALIYYSEIVDPRLLSASLPPNMSLDTALAARSLYRRTYLTSFQPQTYITAAPNRTYISQSNVKLSAEPIDNPSLFDYVSKVVDKFMGVLSDLDGLIKGEIDYALRLGKCDPAAQIAHFKLSITKLDPRLKELENAFRGNKVARTDLVAANDTLASQRTIRVRTPQQRMSLSSAQRAQSLAQTRVKVSSKRAAEISKGFINDLKKYDFVSKISAQLKKWGITGEIKLGKLKTIKVKAGGLFLIWNLKDIIGDLLNFKEWGDEVWKDKLTKDCYAYLDNIIVGIISTVIAQLVVALGVAAVGATVSAGTIAVIVVIVALIVGLIIGWLVSKLAGDDFSFSRFVLEGAGSMCLEAAYGVR